MCTLLLLTLLTLTLFQGKLVVGHNMLLDVMHTIHQFYCPLPEVTNMLSGCRVWVWRWFLGHGV